MGYFTLILLADKLPVREIPLIVRVLIICLCFMNFFIITFKMCNDLQWKDISQKSLHGRTKEMLPKFAELYPKMKRNELFLYNYGAELNYAGYYRESTEIMNECCKKINDYDLQMILADNYYHLKYTLKALETYKNAADMIPCRFLPLYCQFEIYKESGDVNNAIRMAQIIVSKRVKVKSIAVNWIIEAAKEYLKEINQQHDK